MQLGWIALPLIALIAVPAAAAPARPHRAAAAPAKARVNPAETRFWALIDRSVSDDRGRQFAILHDALEALSPSQLGEFQTILDTQLKRAYRWDLWGAAYVAMGGASDDGFEYFRLWLISRGRAAFTRVLAHPDALADIAPDYADAMEFEDLGHIAADTWSAKTGRSWEQMPRPAAAIRADEPAGEPWPEDERELIRRYPKLARRFPLNRD